MGNKWTDRFANRKIKNMEEILIHMYQKNVYMLRVVPYLFWYPKEPQTSKEFSKGLRSLPVVYYGCGDEIIFLCDNRELYVRAEFDFLSLSERDSEILKLLRNYYPKEKSIRKHMHDLSYLAFDIDTRLSGSFAWGGRVLVGSEA